MADEKLYQDYIVPIWATVDPKTISGSKPAVCKNILGGKFIDTQKTITVPDPLNGEPFIVLPDTSEAEGELFADSLRKCPKYGLHNPFHNVERYRMYGAISAKVANALADPNVANFISHLMQRVTGKSFPQCLGEVTVTKLFFQNFSGDQPRFLAKGFTTPGDYLGQQTTGYRWPYGPVGIVAPFNFPLEIPILQLMGALYMGNKVILKCATTTSIVMEQFVRLLHHCGMPMEDVDFIFARGSTFGKIIKKLPLRILQFTGSSEVAEDLCHMVNGKIRVEDAGFDWKILGPDVGDVEYVAWQCDQDAYAFSGQKCSAESILFMHENWKESKLLDFMKQRAEARGLKDLTLGPVLSVTTAEMLEHTNKCLKIPGAKLLWGGKELKDHKIPKCYGAMEATAVYVPLEQIIKKENFGLVCTEIFGPFSIITEYNDKSLDDVLACCEKMTNHLTAGVVSNDKKFLTYVLGHTINGTQYCGRRGRTTGAPQNHWFGPAGDPRGAGIGTPEAIKLVWSCHREIIEDTIVPEDWTPPKRT